jgi:hypothetical protein
VSDAYGLDAMGRQDFLACLDDALEVGATFVRRGVEAGDSTFIAMWELMGGQERFDRRQRWWDAQRSAFAAARR